MVFICSFWIIIPPLVIFFLSDFSGFQLFSLFLPCMEHIEKMKEIISEQEIKKFNYYGSIYTVHLAVLIISAVPLFMWLGRYAYIPFGILFIITEYWALKVEKLKKKNDIQTYKEIVAFTEGKNWMNFIRQLKWENVLIKIY